MTQIITEIGFGKFEQNEQIPVHWHGICSAFVADESLPVGNRVFMLDELKVELNFPRLDDKTTCHITLTSKSGLVLPQCSNAKCYDTNNLAIIAMINEQEAVKQYCKTLERAYIAITESTPYKLEQE